MTEGYHLPKGLSPCKLFESNNKYLWDKLQHISPFASSKSDGFLSTVWFETPC